MLTYNVSGSSQRGTQCSLKENSVGNASFGPGSNMSLENRIAFHRKGSLPSRGSEALGVKWFCGCCEGKAFSAAQGSGVLG